jgi:hypothetical protein
MAVQISQLCKLRGTLKQVNWAAIIRDQAFNEEGWTDEDLLVLNSVADARWWIANRHDFIRLTYKKPLPAQLADSPAPEPVAPRNEAHRQADLLKARREKAQDAREMAKVNEDAFLFAKSVAGCPVLAEATVMALLSRMYKSGSVMRERLKEQARLLLAANAADFNDEMSKKNLDAIERILPKD